MSDAADRPERSDAAVVILINPFRVMAGEEGTFLALWDRTNAIFRASPGYVSARLCAVLPDQPHGLRAHYTHVNVAEWQTAASYAAALSSPEIKRLASDYRAVSTFDPALYHVVRSV